MFLLLFFCVFFFSFLLLSESVRDPVELFPILGHPYSNDGPAIPSIGIFRCPNYKQKWVSKVNKHRLQTTAHESMKLLLRRRNVAAYLS